MLLTESRISIVAKGLILFVLGSLLFLAMGGRASANDAAGPLASFGDDTAASQLGWGWNSQGQDVKVDVILDSSLAGTVYGIEVFIEPSTGTAPKHTQNMGNYGAFPTGTSFCFVFSTTTQTDKSAPTPVGIHLTNAAGVDIKVSDGTVNMVSFTPAATCLSAIPVAATTPTPTPTPAPTATPTPEPTATPTPAPELPATGDISPGSGLILAMFMAGFLLIAAGGTYWIKTRRAMK
jgi:hypothetical protein